MAKGPKAKSITKAEIYDSVAKDTGFSKADVRKFFGALENLAVRHLGKKGNRVLTLPGIAKLTAVPKAAVKGGKPVRNPFTGQMGVSKDKPATVKVRARALKAFIEKIK
ncbi:MAG TPA: HU family DNA-binding protein [Gemmataceae bacterium]|nr:HU family DNA-binding protein [Gemmataceae bacterium]